MKQKLLYRGYYISSLTTLNDEGRFEARVAIMALDGERTRSQRFLDLEDFPTEEQADERALGAAKEFIDAQLDREQPTMSGAPL
jgi:hypothetical protein